MHAVIESELDELVLFEKRGETVATFQPWREILQASDFVLGVVSKMFSYVALTVYGRIVPRDLFARSVRGFRRVQRLFYSKTGAKRAALGRIEQLVRPYSFYQSMSHRPVALTESAYDNRAHEAWEGTRTPARRARRASGTCTGRRSRGPRRTSPPSNATASTWRPPAP